MTTMTYEAWLAAAEKIRLAQIGVALADLADYPYWDWYAAGMTSAEAAREALANELDNMAGTVTSDKLCLD